MPRAKTNGIELEYATHGAREGGRPLVLIRGLGTQMVQWSETLLEKLVTAGHFLVTFDNRDVGLSTWLDDAGLPNISEVLAAVRAGERAQVPYTLDDMADDIAGLLHHLQLESAHIVGMSMGGMLTQTLGYRHAARVRSLTPVMTTTGNPALPPATREAMRVLLAPPARERAAYIAQHVASAKVLAGPVSGITDAARAQKAARLFDRAFHPAGAARQYAAILADGDRRARLAGVRAPTLVIHGDADPLVPKEGGRDVAHNIAGAKWLELKGMGHELPPLFEDELVAAITAHTRAAEAQRR